MGKDVLSSLLTDDKNKVKLFVAAIQSDEK
jgi:hypothetical protein